MDQGKGKEAEPRAKRREKGTKTKKRRALKGIKEKTETIGKKEGKKRG